MLGPLKYVQKHDGALFTLAAFEDGFQVFEGAIGNGDLFPCAEVGMYTLLAMRLGMKRLDQCIGYGHRLVAEGQQSQHATGRADRPPVADDLIQADKQVVGEQWFGHDHRFALTAALDVQHGVKHLVTLIGEVFRRPKRFTALALNHVPAG